VYDNYATEIATIATNKASFTHVSPAFYSLNYDYLSGVAYYSTCPSSGNADCTGNGTNNFNGLTTAQFTAKATAAGLATVPLIYAGSENDGSDTGVQNLLNNTSGAATAFISAMTAEAVSNGYAGYNLDWEMGTAIDNTYTTKFVTFVNNFKAALAPHGMSLSVDAIVSNINGTWCSSNDGYLNFAALATSSIDRIIIEDYINTLGTATTTCQNSAATVLNATSPVDCDYTLTGMMNLMCANLPTDKIVIGLDADPGSTNPIAGTAFADLKSYGFTRVAVWPQDPFMDTSGIVPASDNWYTLLQNFLN
jgi:spore germination protein YaaH